MSRRRSTRRHRIPEDYRSCYCSENAIGYLQRRIRWILISITLHQTISPTQKKKKKRILLIIV
ncbi:unnamed protein product [Ixodes pacificus]